jgi:RNA-directed DNA polymerase
MSKDALQNGGAVLERPEMGSFQPVSGMQTKLHFLGRRPIRAAGSRTVNLVCDPPTLMMAFVRVAGNWNSRHDCRTQGLLERSRTLVSNHGHHSLN